MGNLPSPDRQDRPNVNTMHAINPDLTTRRSAPLKEPKYRTPPGHRVLHLVIDQETFDLLHVQAIRSRMKFTAYMQRFLKEAFPYGQPEIQSLPEENPQYLHAHQDLTTASNQVPGPNPTADTNPSSC